MTLSNKEMDAIRLGELLLDVKSWAFQMKYLKKRFCYDEEGKPSFEWVASQRALETLDWVDVASRLHGVLERNRATAIELGYLKETVFDEHGARTITRVTGQAVLEKGYLVRLEPANNTDFDAETTNAIAHGRLFL